MDKDKGIRLNEGKVRYDLLPEYATNQMAQVFTHGAKKYADYNWALGMRWSKCIAALKRHIAKFEQGDDFDEETGLLHMAHAMTNCAFLIEYYKIYPQGDDRQHAYLKYPRIGLDIDDVICDFVGGYMKKFNIDSMDFWNATYSFSDNISKLSQDELEDFYLNLSPKISPQDMPFEPVCYITSRAIPVELTKAWIEKNKFPCVPVFSLGFNASKVEIAQQQGVELFIDDRFDNFVALNKAGICTFLMDAAHNRRYDLGYKRIYTLNDLFRKSIYTENIKEDGNA